MSVAELRAWLAGILIALVGHTLYLNAQIEKRAGQTIEAVFDASAYSFSRICAESDTARKQEGEKQ